MMNGASIFPQDDKFFSRLSSRVKRYNSSKQVGGEGSFRVLYYGGAAGSVPFLWESQPGTPKNKLSDGPLPPLTPPPQYQSSPLASPSLKKKHSKIFNSIFAKKNSGPTSSSTPFRSRKESQEARLDTIRFEVEEDDDDEYEVGRDSPLCFRTTTRTSCRRSKIDSVKKVVKSLAISKY